MKVGRRRTASFTLAGHTFDMYTYEFLSIVQRYNPNGSLDLTFGNQGTFTEDDEEFNLSGQVFELRFRKNNVDCNKMAR